MIEIWYHRVDDNFKVFFGVEIKEVVIYHEVVGLWPMVVA